jgi:hypothetical protein
MSSRKALMEKIGTLGSMEHAEIFRIFKRHGVPHTQNKNGVFINITSIPNEIIKEVSDFVTYCSHNNRELEEYDKRLNQCKLYQNLDCMSSSTSKPNPSKASSAQSSVQNLMKSIEDSMDLMSRKVLNTNNTKYMTAKKKYSKRQTRVESQTNEVVLAPEEYC